MLEVVVGLRGHHRKDIFKSPMLKLKTSKQNAQIKWGKMLFTKKKTPTNQWKTNNPKEKWTKDGS